MVGIKVIGILIFMGILFGLSIPVLRRSPKEMIIYTIIVTTAGVLSILKFLELTVPTPLYFVSWVYKPISDLILLLQ
ncbi:hypothetical protein [Paenibacillus sp. Marseille-Q4541]|uniref:hypothetical protein n=1 Tax=Paenibacillus sp. Marseille-Q4541 TaxID=2831522 RepID=UPI001BA67557|nr:hypothetical protein [Paenibacillus sp. Marseille-Q4541]